MTYRRTSRGRNSFGDVGPAPNVQFYQPSGLVSHSNPGVPGQTPFVPAPPQGPGGKPRQVRVSQYYFLQMTVPFTSVAGENKIAATVVEQFAMRVRAAWSDLTRPRVRLIGNMAGDPLSSVQVPLRTFASNSSLYDPLLIWRRPFLLSGGSGLRGEFINDGTEAAGTVVFFTERPETDSFVFVQDAQHYVALLDLGLTNGATTQTVNPASLQIDHDLIVYGALSTVANITVRFQDSRTNVPWSRNRLPIGAFAGISNTTNPAAIMWYPTPYYLHRNSSISADILNAGGESGGYIAFICERVLNEASSETSQPQPTPIIQPNQPQPRTDSDAAWEAWKAKVRHGLPGPQAEALIKRAENNRPAVGFFRRP
jgi:hypothetical protein